MNPSAPLAPTLLLLGGLLAAPATAQLSAPAASATEIRPLLIGSDVPSVVVKTMEGEDRDLRGVVGTKPAVLIVYRGGW